MIGRFRIEKKPTRQRLFDQTGQKRTASVNNLKANFMAKCFICGFYGGALLSRPRVHGRQALVSYSVLYFVAIATHVKIGTRATKLKTPTTFLLPKPLLAVPATINRLFVELFPFVFCFLESTSRPLLGRARKIGNTSYKVGTEVSIDPRSLPVCSKGF